MVTTRNPLRPALCRRRFLQLTGVGAGGLSLWGLATGASAEILAAQEATTGEVTIGTDEDGYRSDERANIGMYPLNTNIFESLVRLTPEYQIEPLLAESWELVEPNTWRFTLRQGVTFQDETPFSAEAVLWTMQRIAGTGGGVLGVDENSTVIIDDFTVEITPARPNRRLVEQLNHPNNSILAPNTDPAEVRIGTGPFREVEYIQSDRDVVEANSTYWGELPSVSRITFRFYPDPTSRLLALQAGEVDLVTDVPRQSVQQVSASGDAQPLTSTVGAYEAIYVNIRGQQPYDLGGDPALRQAVASAIDKEAVVQGGWLGNAELGQTMIPPAILGGAGDIIEGTPYDPDQARQLLEDAGWVAADDGIRERDGRRLQLVLINGFPSSTDHGSVPELTQAQLEEAGIEVEIVQTPDVATYEARLATGEGDLWLEAGSQNDGNPCFLPDLLFATPPPDGDPESTMYGRAFAPGEEFDGFIGQCRSAVTVEEVQEAAANAMKLLIDDQFVVIPLAGFYRIYGVSSGVDGLEPHPSGVNQRWSGAAATD